MVAREKKFCEFSGCVFDANFTACIQSDDCQTMFAGLQALMEQCRATAHIHTSQELWGAWIPMDEFEASDDLSERLANIPRGTKHWIRMMVEDEKREVIIFDRTYHPSGEMTEPIPA
jgi:hypothetical protein